MASERSKLKRASSPAVGVRGYRIRDVAKANERRHEILMGAARAFAHGGYDATNMDQIARECGLAKGHIYHYFRSKEEIFAEIRTDAVNRLIEKLTAIAPVAAKDPELALRKAISAVIARIFEEGEHEPLLADPVSLSAENRKRIRALGRRYEQMFANIVRKGIEKGVFVPGDPKLMTFVILRAAFTVVNWYRAGGKWQPRWIVEQVTEQLVRSVRQPAARNTSRRTAPRTSAAKLD
jgi:TetR/AcrR family transcriptional regulator, cholesterol catabolism regulator